MFDVKKLENYRKKLRITYRPRHLKEGGTSFLYFSQSRKHLDKVGYTTEDKNPKDEPTARFVMEFHLYTVS